MSDPSIPVEAVPAISDFLVKQGKKVKNWKRRWFVLKGSQLTYSKDSVSKPLGIINMKDYNPHKIATKDGSSALGICLQHLPSAPSKRDYYIECDSNETREKWFNAMLYATGNSIVASEVLGDLVRRATNTPAATFDPPVFKPDPSTAEQRPASGSVSSGQPWSLSTGKVVERIRPQDLNLEEKLGEGESGQVWRATWRGMTVAAKKLNPNYPAAQFFQEASTLLLIPEHKNIVKGLGMCHEAGNLMLVTEYVSGISLLEKINHELPNLIDINEICRLLLGIAQGMAHLAKEGIVHRDLAARNVMVAFDGTPKITDFGYSRVLAAPTTEGSAASYQTVRQTPQFGPLRWMPPESIADRTFSEKSDVWSFGVLAIELLIGKPPYSAIPNHTLPEILRNGLASPVIEIPVTRTPQWLQSLLNRCFAPLPSNRPPFEQIVKELSEGMASMKRVSNAVPLQPQANPIANARPSTMQLPNRMSSLGSVGGPQQLPPQHPALGGIQQQQQAALRTRSGAFPPTHPPVTVVGEAADPSPLEIMDQIAQIQI